MKIHTFICHVLQKMQEELGEDIKVSLQDVTKNNGVVLTGLTFTQKNVNISPTVYLEDFFEKYREGTAMEDIQTSSHALLSVKVHGWNKCNQQVFTLTA